MTRLLLTLVAVVTVFGCANSADDLGTFPCAMDGSCPTGFKCGPLDTCVKPQLLTACTSTTSCTEASEQAACVLDVCAVKCKTSADCGATELCVSDTETKSSSLVTAGCMPDCTASRVCPTGLSCTWIDSGNKYACVPSGSRPTRCEGTPTSLSCGSVCLDTTADPKNCGGCNQVCAAGLICQGAVCTCILCGGACADLQTSAQHCGACGNACGTGNSCSMGVCVSELATAQGNPVTLAVDSSYVYWLDNGVGTVSRVAKTGGTPSVVATGDSSARALAINSSYVYWVEGGLTDGAVMRAPLSGGSPVAIASDLPMPTALALDSSYVYFATSGTPGIHRVSLSGGIVEELTALDFEVTSLYVGSSSIFVALENGSVLSLALSGGSPSTVASGQNSPSSVVGQGGTAYWLTGSSGGTATGNLMRGNYYGTPPETVASNLGGPLGLLMDSNATYTYLYSATEGSAKRVSLDGSGKVVTLATGQTGIQSLTQDSTYLYWSTSQGVVRRRLK